MHTQTHIHTAYSCTPFHSTKCPYYTPYSTPTQHHRSHSMCEHSTFAHRGVVLLWVSYKKCTPSLIQHAHACRKRYLPLSSSLTASAIYGTSSLLTMNPGVSFGKYPRERYTIVKLVYSKTLAAITLSTILVNGHGAKSVTRARHSSQHVSVRWSAIGTLQLGTPTSLMHTRTHARTHTIHTIHTIHAIHAMHTLHDYSQQHKCTNCQSSHFGYHKPFTHYHTAHAINRECLHHLP